MKNSSILSAAKRHLSHAAALLLLGCVYTAGMAQSYEMLAGKGFTLDSKRNADNATTYQWHENGKLINGANEASLTMPAGKPVGVYLYTRSVEAAGGCGISNAVTVKVIVNPNGTTPNLAASSKTWVSDNLEWSDDINLADGVIPSECEETDIFSDSKYNLKQYRQSSGRSYYSFPCAVDNAAWLCASSNGGWRLPTKDDFDALINWVRNINTEGFNDSKKLGESGDGNWGWGYGGYITGSSLSTIGTDGHYWSSTIDATNDDKAYRLYYVKSTVFFNADSNFKCRGYQVKCVRSM